MAFVQLTPGITLRWHHWEDESVVYNEASGDTHMLDLVAREGLGLVEARSQTASQLTAALAERLAVSADDELAAYVEKLIENFRRLGLVRIVQDRNEQGNNFDTKDAAR